MIYVYNKNTNDYSLLDNHYDITRPNILSNPYTFLDLNKTQALYKCGSREEAIKKYSEYFDIMYGNNIEFTKVVDEIYEKYKNGEDIFLACVCKPKPCHGDVIVEKMKKRLIKEKFKERNARK